MYTVRVVPNDHRWPSLELMLLLQTGPTRPHRDGMPLQPQLRPEHVQTRHGSQGARIRKMGGVLPGTTRGPCIHNTKRTTLSSSTKLVANHVHDNNSTNNASPAPYQRTQHTRLSTVRHDPRGETVTTSNTLRAERAGLTIYGTHA